VKTTTDLTHDIDAAAQLPRLFDEITQRLQRGEDVDIEEYAARHPEHAEKLRQMLPTIAALADLGLTDPIFPQAAAPRLGTLGDFQLLREIGRGNRQRSTAAAHRPQ